MRAASFHPYSGSYIEQIDIETYLRSRVALLVSSDQNPTNRWAVGDMTLPEGGNFGCAVAIDRRGYFLTAAHCLKREFVYLLLYDSQTARALRARVVWLGKKRENQQDLAVLHVQQPLAHTFAWTDGVCSDEPAMAVGLSWSGHEIKGFELLGGKILASQEIAGAAGGFRIASDVPTQSGDSGGPLVDARGRLIGINTRATPPLVHRLLPSRVFPMIAERPSQTWLSEIIEADVARRKAL